MSGDSPHPGRDRSARRPAAVMGHAGVPSGSEPSHCILHSNSSRVDIAITR